MYFSKQLDDVSKGWTYCFRTVVATVLLIQEAKKLTLGEQLTGFVPHSYNGIGTKRKTLVNTNQDVKISVSIAYR